MSTTLEEAISKLKHDPTHPVVAEVDGLMVELRALPAPMGKSAAELFAEVGPWEGETMEEISTFLSEARRRGGSRPVPPL